MKKLLSCLLMLCLILSCTALPAGAFQDVHPGAWYYEPVEYMKSTGIVKGYTDGTFKYHSPVTRADFVVTLSRCAANFEAPDKNPVFEDVAADSYYADAVHWAYAHEIVNGYGKGVFKPTKNVTREEAVQIVYAFVKASGYDMETTPSEKQFADWGAVSPWAREAMTWAIDSGIMNGNNESRLNPQYNMTRAQFCVMLYNARDLLIGLELPLVSKEGQ